MPQQIILRKGTALEWTAAGTVVLAAGEPGFETNTGRFKIGNGTLAWTALPYAVGTIPVNLADLADVTSDTPSSGQVLKWNGSAWAPAADSTGGGSGATYAISAETATGGSLLRLTGSDASTDDVKFEAGTGITITRPDGNTITITNDNPVDTNTTYAISAETATGGVNLRLTGSDAGVDEVKIAEGYGINVTRVDDSTVEVSSNLSLQTISGVGLGYNGFRLIPAIGTAQELKLTPGVGISISRVDAQELLISNTVSNMVGAGTANRLAMYTATGSQVNETNEGLTYTLAGRTLALAAGTHNLYNSNIFQIYDTYSALRTSGITTNNYFDGADTVAWNIVRSRGTYAVKTSVVSGDDIGSIRYYAHTASTPPSAPSAVLKVRVEGSPVGINVPSQFVFRTNNGTSIADRATLSAAGQWRVDSISALNTNANLALSGNGTGIVTLPAGTTVGGVAIGSLVIKGTVADNTALLALPTPTLGDTYVVLSPTPTHLWSYNASSTWVDLGEFQGPTGQGVPVSGTIGQVLTKNSSTNYDTSWTSLSYVATSGAYIDLSGTPTLATVATSGAYADLSGTPTLPNSFATIAIAGQSSVAADSTTDTLTLVAGSGITLTTNAGTDTITIENSASATNSFTTIAVAGQTNIVADSAADTLTLVAGTGITLTTTEGTDTITITNSVADTDTNTTYSIKATTTTGGATLDLDAGGSGSGTDSVTFSGGTGITVSRTDTNTITVASTVTDTNTTYSINAVDGTTGKKIIRLTAGGSGSGDDDVVLVAGTNVTLDRTGDEITINSTASGGGSMATRTTAAATTASINDGATGNIGITGFKSYALLKMVVEHQAWVRVYTDTASRTADASRAEGVDPLPGSGVIAEVITTAAPQTILISPGTIGFNNELVPQTGIPIAVTNKSGTTRTITVTLTVLQLEA